MPEQIVKRQLSELAIKTDKTQHTCQESTGACEGCEDDISLDFLIHMASLTRNPETDFIVLE